MPNNITAPTVGTSSMISGFGSNTTPTSTVQNVDGLDLILLQGSLQAQMVSIQSDMNNIQVNANLSDTEKMFAMQMAMNTWSAIANLRTNMLKSVSDTLKSIARNVS